jgi:hypothetical protein
MANMRRFDLREKEQQMTIANHHLSVP